MTSPHERATNPVDGLVNAYYDQLLIQGRETANMQPAVSLRGASQGDVVRMEGEALHGHAVKSFTNQSVFPEDMENLRSIGFTDEMQREGIWLLRDVAYTHTDGARSGGWSRKEDQGSMTYAHWNGTDWHVARVRRGFVRSESDDWASGWQKPTTDLTDGEKDAVARIARDTNFVLDAAASLQDKPFEYAAFHRALAEKAQASGDEQAVRDMDVLLRPHRILPSGLLSYLYPTAYQLSELSSALYGALSGKGLHSTGYLAIQSIVASPDLVGEPSRPLPIREATLCPPYEEVPLG